ncbi:MAG: integration host factor subunit beta [Calditrichaeota bacterium]|nr:MAG: integration host factor subunit beta [Calditrichota bacterium]
MTVTKADLVNLLADSTGLTKTEIEAVINGFLYNVVESLQDGDRVEIRGFGTFYVKEREARLVKNPRTNQVVTVDHRFVPMFRPAKFFRETVNQRLLAKKDREDDAQSV